MTGRLHILTLCAAGLIVLLPSCTQSGGEVAVYRYGSQPRGQKVFGQHTIQSGETLWGISQAYQVELRDLLDLNHLRPPYNIRAGTRLQIPAPRTYAVQKGDTLYRVSRIFDITTTELAQLNRIKSPFTISKGQTLRLPAQRPAYKPAEIKNTSFAKPSVTAPVEPVMSESLAPAKRPPESSPAPSAPPRQVAVVARTPDRSGKGFLTPVSGRVISTFGPKKDGLHNDGINIKAPRGAGVRAAEHGTVVYAGNEIEGYGNLILLRHKDGYVTAYAHLDKVLAKKGEQVKRGQAIGTVGSTGHVDAPQLHFEIRKGKKAVNPSGMIKI